MMTTKATRRYFAEELFKLEITKLYHLAWNVTALNKLSLKDYAVMTQSFPLDKKWQYYEYRSFSHRVCVGMLWKQYGNTVIIQARA